VSWVIAYVHVCMCACCLRFFQTFFLSRARVLALFLTHTHCFPCTLSPSCRTCALFPPVSLALTYISSRLHASACAPFLSLFPPLPPSYSRSLSFSLTLSLSHALSLSRSVSLTFCLSHALSLARSVSRVLSFSCAISLFLFLPLSPSHTNTRTYTLSHTRTLYSV